MVYTKNLSIKENYPEFMAQLLRKDEAETSIDFEDMVYDPDKGLFYLEVSGTVRVPTKYLTESELRLIGYVKDDSL